MTLGTGLFASTLLLVVMFALWQVTKHRKWRTIGKVVAVLLVLGALSGLAIWSWNVYSNRPRPQGELDGISLGATQLDVQLKKGKPYRELQSKVGSKDVRWIFLDDPQHEEEYTLVLFRERESTRLLRVSIVCNHSSYVSLLCFGRYTDEETIIRKLGKPTLMSIRKDGLAKTISFDQWKAAFAFEKGEMTAVCVSDTGEVRYAEEHNDASPHGDRESE